MTAPDPGRVLRLALAAWGLGHFALGRRTIGRAWLAAEVLGIVLVAWLTLGLADSSAYLIPFLAGSAFLVAWAWQAIDAYRAAHRLQPARAPAPERSPAASIGWLALPLLLWGTGFWVVGAGAATPAAILDQFVADWTSDSLESGAWPSSVVAEARSAADALGPSPERFRDVRVRLLSRGDDEATAVAEAIHYERRESRFLGIFAGSELVPVADDEVLLLRLAATPVELPGGGRFGAVRWSLVSARAP